MKYLKSYKLFESFTEDNKVSIELFLEQIEITRTINEETTQFIINWWKENRSHIILYLFDFNTTMPIAGGIIDVNTIAINKKMRMPPQMKLFLALHESKHIDQYNENRFEEGYFNSVVNDNKELFLKSYKELEKEANDYAIDSMIELGFDHFINGSKNMLKSNEMVGEQVYRMMKSDINLFNPNTMFELIKKQI